MTWLLPRMGRTAVACALALAVLAAPAGARRRDAPAPPPPAVVSGPQPLPLTRDAVDPTRLALQRAALEHARGDFAAVVASLAPLELETSPPFAEADRAAFLLGHAWLRLGQHERFASLARAVASWPQASVFTRWLAFEYHLNGGSQVAAAEAKRTGLAMADALAANRLLADGDPASVLLLIPDRETNDALLLHLRSVALERLGQDDTAELEAIAASDTSSALGRDLAGSALVRLATRVAERGGDPRPWLARVPTANRFAARARHMAALATLESGDSTAGSAALERMLAEDTLYAGRREVAQALAGQALDRGRWVEAHARYAAADADWRRARESLRQKLAPEATASLWAAWESGHSLSGALMLDGLPAAALTEQLAREAGNLSLAPGSREPTLELADSGRAAAADVPPPASDSWDRVAASTHTLAAARGEWTLVADSLARERVRLGDERRYLGHGLSEVRTQERSLAESSARLDSLHALMDETAQRLLALRDAAALRFQRRAAAILDRGGAQECWIRAMDHFYLQGPDRRRQAATPPTWKGPDVVLAQESELAQSLRFSAARVLKDTPRRTAAAYEKAWGPRLIDRASLLAEGARTSLAWARALDKTVDSSLALARTSPEETRLAARTGVLARHVEQLAASDARLRTEVAREAVTAALRALDGEREGLDYGLAAAAYARSVRLAAADSLPAAAVVGGAPEGGPMGGNDPFEAASDSVSRAERDEAISRASIFLADHPDSPARGEMRFRLADLLVTHARTDFRDRMAAWLRAQAQGRAGTLPVVDHSQPLALYRSILAEDPDLPHRDAVLFNAGMLLADSGDPAAGGFFTRLLEEYPASPYVQESSLRLGDLAFDAQRLGEGVGHYQRAAAGGDASLRAIALYKTGWAHYNSDRFAEAAESFRGVLDLYAGDERPSVQADIEHEAEQYFVYSLAAAGGAEAYERAFPPGSARPYERRVLRAMGQHFRRYGEFADAATVDQLYLKRWPSDPSALDVVSRLAETQQRAERPAEERATRLAWAEQFAPGGEWAAAQSSDSLRSAGAEFARSAWRGVAYEHHRKARVSSSREDWREALRHYQMLISRWPADTGAAVFELHAGEASAELGEYAEALAHYGRAAGHGRDSVATRAAWQQVAVTDRWYESTRPAAVKGAARGTGRDSLARAVVASVEALLQREPRHPQAADLVWREVQLSLAHGWNEEALTGLARFARSYPTDSRAPLAASERAQVYFRAGNFAAAGGAFEEALAVARRAGDDSLARRAERALPVCAWRAAEAAVAADSTKHSQHAELFAEVARRWPAYEHAPIAQYRAGLAWFEAGRTGDGVKALQALAEHWPNQPLAREARLRSAQAWEAAGQDERAAVAWLEFSKKHPRDENADEAWLKAADLSDSAGQGTRADTLRAQYLARWPADEESALEILEHLAQRELAALPAGRSVTTLLARPRQIKSRVPAGPVPYLAQYMKRIAQKPAKASKPLLAEVRFRYAEEAFQPYLAARLTQPLPRSIAAKQRLLDTVLVRYRRTVDMAVTEWAHAATFRIGESLVAFGEALEKSERPADLTGDDLKAYDNVLLEQSVSFHDRGETVWTEMLKRSPGTADAWTTRTRGALWARLGDRFLFRPENDFPVVEGNGPGRTRAPRPARDTSTAESARPTRIATEEDK